MRCRGSVRVVGSLPYGIRGSGFEDVLHAVETGLRGGGELLVQMSLLPETNEFSGAQSITTEDLPRWLVDFPNLQLFTIGGVQFRAAFVAAVVVVILPDSFRSRGFPDGVCTVNVERRSEVSQTRRARDAYAALAYLRSLPFVYPARIFIWGWSYGGYMTLAATLTQARREATGRRPEIINLAGSRASRTPPRHHRS